MGTIPLEQASTIEMRGHSLDDLPDVKMEAPLLH